MSSDPRDELAGHFAALLRVDRDRIDTAANVLELGADSIMLMEARTLIEARYGHRIEIRRFFEDLTTIEAIAAHLAELRSAQPGAETLEASPSRAVAAEEGAPSRAAPRGGDATPDLRLMRAQLALVAEVIEAQNRVAAVFGPLAAPSPQERAAGPAVAQDASVCERASHQSEIVAA